MKVCPKCNAEFDDKVNFCLNDGTPVVSQSQRDVPTESFSAPLVDEPAAEPQPTAGYTASTAGAVEQQTGANEPIATRRPPPAKKRSSTILWVLLAVGLASLFIIVLGVAGLLYYMVYRQPEVAKVNSNSIVISNANSTNGDSNLSDANSLAPGPNSNSSLPSNSISVPTSNTNANAAANRRVTPTPAKTVEPRGTPTSEVTPPPPPTPERPIPKVISGGVLNGRAISLPKPAYPPAARAVRAGGSVNVQVLIDEQGRVLSAHAISGNPLLTAAAESAARGARFSPTFLSGQPVKVSGVITYNFVP